MGDGVVPERAEAAGTPASGIDVGVLNTTVVTPESAAEAEGLVPEVEVRVGRVEVVEGLVWRGSARMRGW